MKGNGAFAKLEKIPKPKLKMDGLSVRLDARLNDSTWCAWEDGLTQCRAVSLFSFALHCTLAGQHDFLSVVKSWKVWEGIYIQ